LGPHIVGKTIRTAPGCLSNPSSRWRRTLRDIQVALFASPIAGVIQALLVAVWSKLAQGLIPRVPACEDAAVDRIRARTLVVRRLRSAQRGRRRKNGVS